ncbi:MAG: UDP-N-acetylmuramyl-tripeptide synthetase [Pelagibacteraceae bacterium]|jgi:UDP-N-acetylmuramyl-tripeptide synthetase|nr:UDP-N-acetylmuramyl-tripeptide synthetase [Pelagibacteraceae bacterium]MBO6466521.1 UDP-N-acetylmuramyl-tripeptide synthetase [Pelagibacteraceae bacterium]MBO6470081.1 UDP-N-acetylmuramyl-tripeptide synthetase [Pelagibacteraceae bacterium]MBO6471627.1 UDP-N-acetylmuramyl-tripeptide synthetase [Pelagibacteraceae bacterium]MBO6478371.1 UDP-N-acetylmuramyl-tripeptide synthetase [Pelagibacteraceae bacterium]
MLLSKISTLIDCKKIYNIKKKNTSFNFLSTNSKYIKKNSVLVINKKNNFKKKYVDESIRRGAIALITNYYFKNIKIPQFIVKDVNKSLKKLLWTLKKIPPNNIIGVTGTNGKTSVVWNISNILFLSKKNVKSYGTLGFYNNQKKIENSILTTPEYEILHQKAFTHTKKNIDEFVFEVSSHSISKQRINHFPINIAAITNISKDHLDFHKTILNYRNTKFKLFTQHLKDDGVAILNDNINGIAILKKKLKQKKIKIITYGARKSNVHCFKKNNKFYIKIFNKNFFLKLFDYNKFELDNLSCAVGCCISIGIKNKEIINSIAKINKPRGRLQEIGKLKDGSKVIIDYAHTPDALKNILFATKINNIKPNLLFGCGGNRDKSKRKTMGLIANKFAAKVYVTDDNPRNENPFKIRQSILSKCSKAVEIPDRSIAIQKAINELNNGEILIIAGKGHEEKQIIKNKIVNFNDAKIARFYLNRRNKL